MSSALPAGGPSRISVSTTSPSSLSTIRCAVVDPTKPPPTTVTFFRLIFCLLRSAAANRLVAALTTYYRYCSSHILNNRSRERARSQLRRSGHQPLQIVGHFLLLNGLRNSILDQVRRFVPSEEL